MLLFNRFLINHKILASNLDIFDKVNKYLHLVLMFSIQLSTYTRKMDL